jgi:hypothetical protein
MGRPQLGQGGFIVGPCGLLRGELMDISKTLTVTQSFRVGGFELLLAVLHVHETAPLAVSKRLVATSSTQSPCVLVATLPAAHTAVAALDGNRAAIGARGDIDARSAWADTNADTCAGNDHAGTAIAGARWTAVVEPLICADRWWAGNIAPPLRQDRPHIAIGIVIAVAASRPAGFGTKA